MTIRQGTDGSACRSICLYVQCNVLRETHEQPFRSGKQRLDDDQQIDADDPEQHRAECLAILIVGIDDFRLALILLPVPISTVLLESVMEWSHMRPCVGVALAAKSLCDNCSRPRPLPLRNSHETSTDLGRLFVRRFDDHRGAQLAAAETGHFHEITPCYGQMLAVEATRALFFRVRIRVMYI